MENTAPPNNKVVSIANCKRIINIKHANMEGSHFQDVYAAGLKITDANLSGLEIDGAQLGGAYIHNIGLPPEGHPYYDANAVQRPLRFDNCDLNGSTINNCNLANVSITDCNITGMQIYGIPVEDMLKAYRAK